MSSWQCIGAIILKIVAWPIAGGAARKASRHRRSQRSRRSIRGCYRKAVSDRNMRGSHSLFAIRPKPHLAYRHTCMYSLCARAYGNYKRSNQR